MTCRPLAARAYDLQLHAKEVIMVAKRGAGNLSQDSNSTTVNTSHLQERLNRIYQALRKQPQLKTNTGLFDYLDRRIAARLIENLRKLLKEDGILAVSDVRDKYQNPSVHFMEWVGDWNLVYRSDEEFRRIFLDAGFKEKELQSSFEQQGVMQYIIGKRTE